MAILHNTKSTSHKFIDWAKEITDWISGKNLNPNGDIIFNLPFGFGVVRTTLSWQNFSSANIYNQKSFYPIIDLYNAKCFIRAHSTDQFVFEFVEHKDLISNDNNITIINFNATKISKIVKPSNYMWILEQFLPPVVISKEQIKNNLKNPELFSIPLSFQSSGTNTNQSRLIFRLPPNITAETLTKHVDAFITSCTMFKELCCKIVVLDEIYSSNPISPQAKLNWK